MNGNLESYIYATFKALGTTISCLPVGDNVKSVIELNIWSHSETEDRTSKIVSRIANT